MRTDDPSLYPLVGRGTHRREDYDRLRAMHDELSGAATPHVATGYCGEGGSRNGEKSRASAENSMHSQWQ